MKPHRVTRIIVACAVLHNLRLQWGEPQEGSDSDQDQPPTEIFQGTMDGKGVRQHIVQTYF